MLSLRALRRKRRALQGIEKITRSMKMVSAAKMKRAVERLNAFSSFSSEMESLLYSLLSSMENYTHPLLKEKPGERLLVLISSDRGLCGSFNANLIRTVETEIKKATQEGRILSIYLLGKKGIDYFTGVRFRATGLKVNVVSQKKEIFSATPRPDDIYPVAEEIEKCFLGEFGSVDVVFSKFFSPLKQVPAKERLLPLRIPEKRELLPFIIEPGKEVVDEFVEWFYKVRFSLCVYETIASEHAARMSAMENASRNVSELIKKLTLQFNKARQASITKELLDIITGKEALER